MLKFLNWLAVAIAGCLSIGLIVLSLAAGLAVAANQTSKSEGSPDPWIRAALRDSSLLSEIEVGTARKDHADVAQAVARCSPMFENPFFWSRSTAAMLLIQTEDTPNLFGTPRTKDEGRESSLHLTFFQKAALSFSDKLVRDRLQSRYELDRSRWWAFAFQIAVVGLGAMATILIGVRSVIKEESRYITLYAFLAIAFSAAGTAVATLSTFADYQTTQLRANRTLAQLQQLHWRLASDVLNSLLICTPDDSNIVEKRKQTDAWGIRYETVKDGAVVSLARPGDLNTGAPSESSGSGNPLQKTPPSIPIESPIPTSTALR